MDMIFEGEMIGESLQIICLFRDARGGVEIENWGWEIVCLGDDGEKIEEVIGFHTSDELLEIINGLK